MSIKVINNIECFDVKHEAPRILSIQSSDKYNTDDEWVELHCDNIIYRIRAQDIHNATANATRIGK